MHASATHSCGRRPRHAGGEAAFGAAQVRRHADAVERAHEDVSAVSELWPDILSSAGRSAPSEASEVAPHPPRAGSKPSRRDQSRRRRGLVATPDHENKYEHRLGFRGRRSYDRRGVAPSPALRPEAESGIREYATEMQRGQRVSRTLASEGYAGIAAVGRVTPKPDHPRWRRSKRGRRDAVRPPGWRWAVEIGCGAILDSERWEFRLALLGDASLEAGDPAALRDDAGGLERRPPDSSRRDAVVCPDPATGPVRIQPPYR